MALLIQVRFCGGCNPDIDRGGIVRQIISVLGKKAAWTFDAHPQQPIDLILLVNGCPHACMEEDARPLSGSAPMISIQGLHLDRNPVAEPDLALCAANKIIAMATQ